ncbi:hypothetical protein [Bacillus sp. CH30_1T]|uniref:hypothetical protein n=1 Tax=Bacillus sp. CH30_1T TaxID=2604836 RepID=UPI00165EAA6A|nr:hypothetical protein [Bacillus sp. CH30_1T]
MGVPRPRSAKLRRLCRTLAASGAVPHTIQHKLVDRALADSMLENINLAKRAKRIIIQSEEWRSRLS